MVQLMIHLEGYKSCIMKGNTSEQNTPLFQPDDVIKGNRHWWNVQTIKIIENNSFLSEAYNCHYTFIFFYIWDLCNLCFTKPLLYTSVA